MSIHKRAPHAKEKNELAAGLLLRSESTPTNKNKKQKKQSSHFFWIKLPHRFFPKKLQKKNLESWLERKIFPPHSVVDVFVTHQTRGVGLHLCCARSLLRSWPKAVPPTSGNRPPGRIQPRSGWGKIGAPGKLGVPEKMNGWWFFGEVSPKWTKNEVSFRINIVVWSRKYGKLRDY